MPHIRIDYSYTFTSLRLVFLKIKLRVYRIDIKTGCVGFISCIQRFITYMIQGLKN